MNHCLSSIMNILDAFQKCSWTADSNFTENVSAALKLQWACCNVSPQTNYKNGRHRHETWIYFTFVSHNKKLQLRHRHYVASYQPTYIKLSAGTWDGLFNQQHAEQKQMGKYWSAGRTKLGTVDRVRGREFLGSTIKAMDKRKRDWRQVQGSS